MKSKTENMLVDIDSVPKDKNAVEEIEFLSRINSWKDFKIGVVPRWNLHRYLVILYSADSYLNKKNPIPLPERKQKALIFAEIENSDDVTNELLLLENDLALKMIIDFLIAQKNSLWTEIVTTEQQYEEAVKLRMQPIDNKAKDSEQLAAANKKRALRIDCKEMQGDIDSFYRKFFEDHDDVKQAIRERATTLEMLAKNPLTNV
jgi:hypothetical protein